MKFSEQWLRSWVNPKISTDELAHQLTMAGLEVDAVEPVAAEFSNVVVGEVVKVEPHPDADKLRVTQVNVGEEELLDIVCGAANVRKGMRVPVAVIGAVLPGDFKIKKAKLRGVPSFGMLCSASELGLAESSSGLMELPADSPVGEDLRVYLELDDRAIELGLTPNRGDCLSIEGIAREVAVLNRMEVTPVDSSDVEAQIDDTVTVTIEASDDCPRYLCRVIRGVNPKTTTPLWMVERLRRCGIRSLGPVVDVTNYILLELGQPMHAFDLAKLNGGIVVRKAKVGEQLTLLNDETLTLTPEALVIADAKKPLALAGIMGGAESAVSDNSCDILLESAFFAPERIAGRARGFGLHTDSSHRFERGVSAELARRAIERATRLLLEIVGGQAGGVVEQGDRSKLPQRDSILLRQERLSRVLGFHPSPAEVGTILTNLFDDVTEEDGGWRVVAPAHRFDLTIEEDLLEEVGRIIGYDNIPRKSLLLPVEMLPRSEGRLEKRALRRLLVARGYHEAISYSFVDPKVEQILNPTGGEGIMLANPISSEMSQMRSTLWSGLLPLLSYNLKRQQERIRLFETGLSFHRREGGIAQEPMVAGVIYGGTEPEQWDGKTAKSDFFDLKGDVESLLEAGNNLSRCRFEPQTSLPLHPGQSAAIVCEGKTIGRFGALHPSVEKSLSLPKGVLVFELELSALLTAKVPNFTEISKYPAIRRDIALLVDNNISAQQLLDCVRNSAPESLLNLKLFDLYQGEHIDSGRKSIALGLTLQEQSRTLKDEEVDAAINNILRSLEREVGATIRE